MVADFPPLGDVTNHELKPIRSLNTGSPSKEGRDRKFDGLAGEWSFDEGGMTTVSESDLLTDDDAGSSWCSMSSYPQKEAYVTVRHRSEQVPPSIFFGTPSRAEEERRVKYQTRIRTRRLLRKDSIELARRKSGGRSSTSTVVPEEVTNSDKTLDNERREDSLQSASTDDVQGGIGEERDPDETEEADWFGNVSHPLQEEECLPSTPTQQVLEAHPLHVSNTTPDVSDADSSPGVALSSRKNGYYPSPLVSQEVKLTSPFARSPLGLQNRSIQITSIDENEKENKVPTLKTYHPSEIPDSIEESKQGVTSWHKPSPVKQQVRQTLTAWANAKLQTPQSPEKREWNLLRDSQLHSLSPSKQRKTTKDLALTSNKADPASERVSRTSKKNAERTPSHQSEERKHLPCSTSPKVHTSVSRSSRLPVPLSKASRPLKTSAGFSTQSTSRKVATAGHPSSSASTCPANIRRKASPQVMRSSLVKKDLAPPNPSGMRDGQDKHQVLRNGRREQHRSISSTPAKPVIIRSAKALCDSNPNSRQDDDDLKARIVRDARLIAAKKMESSEVSSVPFSPQNNEDKGMTPLQRDTPSAGVGSARRILLGSAPVRHGEETGLFSKNTAAMHHAHPKHSSVRDVYGGKPRPMRKIGDYIDTGMQRGSEDGTTKSEPNLLTDERQSGHATMAEEAQRREDVSKPPKKREAKSEANARILGSTKAIHTKKPRAVHVTLPLSGAELSKLTSQNTRLNESSSTDKEITIIRKEGLTRPPSPSSKFRKTHMGTTVVRTSARSRDLGPLYIDHDTSKNKHLAGAGDDEPYTSPVRRISLKKFVRWHPLLFDGASDMNLDENLEQGLKEPKHALMTALPPSLKCTVSTH